MLAVANAEVRERDFIHAWAAQQIYAEAATAALVCGQRPGEGWKFPLYP